MVMNTAIALLATNSTAAAQNYSNGFVVLMGICVVFVGLISIVILASIMSAIIRAFEGKKPEVVATPTPVAATVIANRGELVAAISACVAEELGTDVSAIRIVSLKAV